jgi:peroxiredoxin
MKAIYIFTFFLLFQNISYSQTDSITVYVFLREDCVISQNYTSTLNRLYQIFSSQKIGFIGLFPSTRDESIVAFRNKYHINIPLKSDYFQTITKELGATVTPEVIVYNEICNEILYQGRIDDTYFRVGKKRSVTTTAELEEALKAIVNGKTIAVRKTQPIGCLISFNN